MKTNTDVLLRTWLALDKAEKTLDRAIERMEKLRRTKLTFSNKEPQFEDFNRKPKVEKGREQ